jgi:hypothetical protein
MQTNLSDCKSERALSAKRLDDCAELRAVVAVLGQVIAALGQVIADFREGFVAF